MNESRLDLEHFRRSLHALREELRALGATGEAAAQTVELDQTRVGRLSRMDALQAQAMSQASNRRRMKTLRGVESALGRIDRGDFGECQDCGEMIILGRLEFDPTVTVCISCAESREA